MVWHCSSCGNKVANDRKNLKKIKECAICKGKTAENKIFVKFG